MPKGKKRLTQQMCIRDSYTDTELAYYVNQKVNIKWDIDDVTKLYVYDMDGKKICEACLLYTSRCV